VKEVLAHYILGFAITAVCLYVTYKLHRIPFLGFILSSVLTYYVFLVAAYYFTQLFRKTSVSAAKTGE
jgi:uncharacterized membrane protein (GlpM family)